MRLITSILFLTYAACSSTPMTAGDPCTTGGDRDCDGETTLMCLCNGDDAFASDCGEQGGTWTEQTTFCASCQQWLDDRCPVE